MQGFEIINFLNIYFYFYNFKKIPVDNKIDPLLAKIYYLSQYIVQGTLTEGVSSVQLTSLLRWLVFVNKE